MSLLDKFSELTGIEYVEQPLSYATGEDEVTLAIKGYRQTRTFTCGFVAGLTVLHTFRPKANETNFYNACNPSEEFGTSTGKLVTALRQFKVGVSLKKKMTFDDIALAIDEGTPIITTIKIGIDEHWIVLYGYGVGPNRVFFAGNNFPYSPFSTSKHWPDFKKLLPSNQDWLICWGK